MKRLVILFGTLTAVSLTASCSDGQFPQMPSGLDTKKIGAQLDILMPSMHNRGSQVGGAVGQLSNQFNKILIGGAIGKKLDSNDRTIATRATEQVLSQPAPSYLESPGGTTTPSSTAPQRPSPRPSATARPSQPARWVSDHSDAKGTATLVAVQPAASGGECRTVHEIAYISGKEISQDQKYCKSADGAWETSNV